MTKTAVILAAGMGVRLQGLVKDVPKGFVTINGQTLIEASIEKLQKHGIENTIIVTGHLCEFYERLADKLQGVTTIKNEIFATSGSMYSLYVAKELLTHCHDGFLLLESDLIYQERAVPTVLNHPQPNAILMSGFTKSGDEVWIESKNNLLVNMSKTLSILAHVDGELVGISKISAEMYSKMLVVAEKMFEQSLKVEYEQCIVETASLIPVHTVKIEDLVWAEIDDPSHMKRVLELVAPRIN